MKRRHFLKASAAAVLAVAGGPGGRMIPIIDTHQHLWDLDKFKLAWMTRGEGPLGRSFRPADYAEATAGLGVVKAIYMEVDVTPEQHVAEAEYVLGLIRSAATPMVAAVISGRPASQGFASYLDRLKGEPAIKGIRQVLHVPTTPAGYCLDPAFVRGICELGRRNMSFDLCMRSAELGDAAKLIDACPETRFILDHCGNESVRAKDHSPWKRLVDEIAAKGDRVVCKVSGIVASAQGHPWNEAELAPVVNHVLDAFGPDRVMFGGDWPVCTLAATYRRWVETLQAIVKDRPEVDRKKLFHDNAARFYSLA